MIVYSLTGATVARCAARCAHDLDNGSLLAFLARRLVFGALVVLTVAVFDYGMPRVLRADLYPGQALVGGMVGDVRRALLGLDFGEACSFFGCPKIRTIFARDLWADLYLLGGSLAIGVSTGVAAGAWCATRPRTRGARAVEALAVLVYCTPVYVMGL